MVRRPGVDEGRARRGSAAVADHGDERRDDPPRTPRVGGWSECFSARADAPVGGRPAAVEKKDPTLVTDLLRLVQGETAGSPMRHRKWVRRSLRQLSRDLRKAGHAASHTSVGVLLREQDYSLRTNVKRFTGLPHPDRNRQFAYIEMQKAEFLTAGLPVISVDTKKKELIGDFKNDGRTWCRRPDEVNAHDFKQDASARAVPYGLYVLNQNQGFVFVGISADTPQFAVDAIARWWLSPGQWNFPKAGKLLILCDAGGSNSYRARLWKWQLQGQLADRFGLAVTVCHYPTGASKWNPVEHRLFAFISNNWAGKPLRSLPLMLGYIRGTQTETGLRVRAQLIRKHYRTKVKVTTQAMKTIAIHRHEICPDWNYTIEPRPALKVAS
jgi:hypothetical protein